jgi:hypothetical protein
MIRITVELVPHGDESKATMIETMLIANDATGNYIKGNYAYAYSDISGVKSGVVKKHPRRMGAWPLIAKALADKEHDRTDLSQRLVTIVADTL